MPMSLTQEEELLSTKEYAYEFYKDLEEATTLLLFVARVQKYCKLLAKVEEVSEFIVELSAILHKIGLYKGLDNYEISSYELAQKQLNKLNLGAVEKQIILTSIIRHNSTKRYERESVEEKILRSACVLAELFDPDWNTIDFSKVPKDYLRAHVESFEKRLCIEHAQELAKEKMSLMKKYL
jgi:HD superfamily phosphodiesterase